MTPSRTFRLREGFALMDPDNEYETAPAFVEDDPEEDEEEPLAMAIMELDQLTIQAKANKWINVTVPVELAERVVISALLMPSGA